MFTVEMSTRVQAAKVACVTGGRHLAGKPRKDGTPTMSRMVEVGDDFETVRAGVESVSVLYTLYETDIDGQRRRVPSGWIVKGAKFEVEWPRHPGIVRSHFGARRFAYNQAIAQVKSDLDARKIDPAHTSVGWSAYELRKHFNTVKDDIAPWWAENSKEAYATGAADAAQALKNWSDSKSGRRKGRAVGFPRFKARRKDTGRVRFTTGTMRVEEDRRHITVPVIGRLRSKENTRRIQRYLAKGRARILNMTLSEQWGRLFVSISYAVYSPWQQTPAKPQSRAGVDLGLRQLAAVADIDTTTGEMTEHTTPAVRALNSTLAARRRAGKQASRRIVGSRGYREAKATVTRLDRKAVNQRREAAHQFTTRLARTYGQVVIEDLDVAAMKRSMGRRAFRRSVADAALGLIRPMLAYKAGQYGSELIIADRWFPSSQIHHGCGTDMEACWLEWTGSKLDKQLVCPRTGAVVDRDDNAAANLRDWPDMPVDAQLVRRPHTTAIPHAGAESVARTTPARRGLGRRRKTLHYPIQGTVPSPVRPEPTRTQPSSG